MNIRLIVVDEHALIRLGLTRLLAGIADIELVGEAGTVAEARALVEETRPTVVMFDTALPDGDGWDMARELRAADPTLGLVLLSSNGDDAAMTRALDEGLSAFVSKDAPPSNVLAAVRHAAQAPRSFNAVGLAAALARRRASVGLLSQRERQVLALMRDGISLPGIADRLAVSEATVKTYVARLYTKLRVNNRSQALMAAVTQGLLDSAAA
ncbi:response regulator transcription factor [Virgisporangium aurantiacum]|uniref:DNA-binding response regulator n=1 Tax=Virgisporangium aurantiacum TaxID=175570 RepID=A0A8J4DVJ9_9ACTN|nr:response regulator transcription factor [Virgisporangium aurantiacum]GIJ52495.1 DNA-binding response regulator [Virgisporangium aurantiacum]